MELRKKAGETAVVADYVPRFREYGEQILTALRQASHTGLTLIVPPTSSGREPETPPPMGEPFGEPGSALGRAITWDPALGDGGEPVAVPERIGRFRVIRLIGQGNFVVYLAHDDRGCEVALKVARPGDPFSRRRMLTLAEEAQRLRALDHPGIVKLREFVAPAREGDPESAGLPGGFIVLEYVQGTNLEEVLQQTRIAPARLAEIIAEVAEAVHHAHSLGLVHRDLKPPNILIDTQGNARVCDFGLAVDEEIQRLRRGEVAGTPPYMAPEQVSGEINRLDGRTDIWALGVILYRGLTGRPPFRGGTTSEYFDEILNREPRPPRQYDAAIPRELERICIRCLSRQMSDRYLTAADLAEELRRWLVAQDRELRAVASDAAVVPRGLRGFGAEDAGYFLGLLPGPRGSDGLPESVRFWRRRIEGNEPAVCFSTGVIYGPSGGGKSSFVKAGLLPVLDRSRVRAIVLEASPGQTEALLLAGLRGAVPYLPEDCNLPEAVALLRDDPNLQPRRKLLLVLDQFEQWLQGRTIEPSLELVRALRQCDGKRVQALLLVRDDFWMALTRVLRAIEVPLVEGVNSAAVELFDRRHTLRVLEEYGRALGRLPAGGLTPGSEEARFLDRAVEALASADGRVTPVRLSLFVEVVRNRPWNVQTFRSLGGVDGIGVKFLEQAFDSSSASPAHRVQARAAQAALEELLPSPEEVLRGVPRSALALARAAGYADKPADFADLIRVLDRDLRLITPVEHLPADSPPAEEPPGNPTGLHFQLAHDYLIQPIRQWIDRNQRFTQAGRARRRLRAITAAWLERPGGRQLPSAFEYAGILRNTDPGDWTPDEKRLLRAASWRFLGRLAVAAGIVAAAVTGGKLLMDEHEARARLNVALAQGDGDLEARINELVPYQRRVVAELQAREASSAGDENERKVTAILLYRFAATADRGRILRALALEAPGPGRLSVIRGVLAAHPEHAGADALCETLRDASAEPRVRLRAACVLAVLEPVAVEQLGSEAPILARALIDEGGQSLPGWMDMLEPALGSLAGPLSQLCSDPEVHSVQSVIAAEVLAEILKRRGDARALAERMIDSLPDPALILIRQLAKMRRPGPALDFLRSVLRPAPPDLAQGAATKRQAAQQAMAVIALDALGDHEVLWTRLRHAPDASTRGLLIVRLAALCPNQQRLLARLAAPGIDPGERQALLMIWAETPRGSVAAPVQARVLGLATGLFLDDPDPGVHSAAELLCARWSSGPPPLQEGQEPRVQPADPDRPAWRVGPNGHTFAIVPGPLVFQMGSPEHEEGRFAEEPLHSRTIDRSIAVSTTEVTISQFRVFDSARKPDGRYTREPDCPATRVSWADAVRYCNWLSQRAGIPRQDWFYPENMRPDPTVPEPSMERSGYRLPTEAEWEYLCRAGTMTARPCGDSEELLPRQAWTWVNSQDRTWPVGQLLPNALGLFDTLGNAWEWCHDRGRAARDERPQPYTSAPAQTSIAGDDPDPGPLSQETRRILRGGAFNDSPAKARSAHRAQSAVGVAEFSIGFRIVRTLPRTKKLPANGGS